VRGLAMLHGHCGYGQPTVMAIVPGTVQVCCGAMDRSSRQTASTVQPSCARAVTPYFPYSGEAAPVQ
jgi:hypothetical protein